MAGKSSGGEQQITDYYMSLHLGVCAYRATNHFLRLYFGEKVVWPGDVYDNNTFYVDHSELHGGQTKEGGARGLIYWLKGAVNQVMPEELAALFGLTSATCPGFRGLSSIFLTGGPAGGFYVGSNNPYLKPFWVRVRGVPDCLNPAIAMIRLPDDPDYGPQYAANPSHIIYECLTNVEWGMGGSPASIDTASFEAAAAVLYNEDFGLSFLWSRQTDIESFVQEVIDHIQATMFIDPTTGKHTIKLLRNDYTLSSLPTITPDNADMISFKRKLWGESANEVVVTWTDPTNEKEKTVTAQDLAAIAMQGRVVSASRNYYGVRSEALAMRLAERDVSAMSSPIATCEVEVDRSMWQLVPGDVVKVYWPEHDIQRVVFRVMEIDYGGPDASRIRLVMHEDIFSLDKSVYLTGQPTQWVSHAIAPAPATRVQKMTAPAYLTVRSQGLRGPSELVYPEVQTALLVGENTAADISHVIMSLTAGAGGGTSYVNVGERPMVGSGTLAVALVAEAVTPSAVFDASYIGAYLKSGDFMLIGEGTEAECEIAMVYSVVSGVITLWRGVLDTVPRIWPVGTRMWMMTAEVPGIENTARSAWETATYKIRPRTPKGLLPIASAPVLSVGLTDRPYRPNRPANTRLHGVDFGWVDAAGLTDMTVTWSNRNRLVEVTQVFSWTEATMTPEVGQLTKVSLMKLDRTPITAFWSTGTSLTFPVSAFAGETFALVRITAVLSPYESIQGNEYGVLNIPV